MVPKSTRSLLLQQYHLLPQIVPSHVAFALKQAYQSQESKFMIFSDSPSAMQALEKLNSNHPLLIQIQDKLHKIEVDQKGVVFMWVPGHVGICGNEAADIAAKQALEEEPIDDLMPFSDLKPLTTEYTHCLAERMG